MGRIFVAVWVSLICVLYLQGQVSDLVPTDGIVHQIHQDHLGEIVFLPRNIPLDSLEENDFLKNYDLNRNSNLNIRVFMDNSIINYQHPLAPKLTEEELNISGNYQFAFYVDRQLIYQENIHYGCGLRKNETTTFRVPLTDTKGADFWSIYLFERFKRNGGSKALSEGAHVLSIEMKPYVKINENEEAIVGELIAKGQLIINIKPIKISAKEIAIQVIKSHPDFEISKDKFDKKSIKALNKAILKDDFKEITGIAVIKEGKLLLEEYFSGADRNTLHDTRSVGKSFASILMGIAINDGYIKDEHETLNHFYDLSKFENNHAQKQEIELRDLLTMSAAFEGSDQDSESPGNEENMYPTSDWVKFTLDLPIDEDKSNGAQWDYFTAGVVVLGDILHRSVPSGLEKYADEKLFNPLNIRTHQWQFTPQNVANTAGGLKMTVLDYAKIGQLYQNNGRWKDLQIVPESWVEKSLSKQIQIPGRKEEFYGFLFWNKSYHVDGKEYEVYYCAGNGGNKIFIFKDVPLTIVITAQAYNRAYGHTQVDKMMEEFILPAVLD